jgi:hypothetical protein
MISSIKEVWRLFLTKYFSFLKKEVQFKVAIIEINPRIPWVLFTDPLGSAEHSLGNCVDEDAEPLVTQTVTSL